MRLIQLHDGTLLNVEKIASIEIRFNEGYYLQVYLDSVNGATVYNVAVSSDKKFIENELFKLRQFLRSERDFYYYIKKGEEGENRMNTFKIGDIVQLKSGGPWMTVSSEQDEDSNKVNCKWFNSDNFEQSFQLCNENFHIDSLRLKEEKN